MLKDLLSVVEYSLKALIENQKSQHLSAIQAHLKEDTRKVIAAVKLWKPHLKGFHGRDQLAELIIGLPRHRIIEFHSGELVALK